MVGQDEMGLVADDDTALDIDPVLLQLVDLRQQRLRIDDHTVPDHTDHAGMENAGRDEPQDELGPSRVDGMAGVVAALISRDDVEARRQQIDDLAFAFVAPLRT